MAFAFCNIYQAHTTIIDTPGVLSGEKQRAQRSYDFTGVISWFAEKGDLILLLFDPYKLDISDEFKRVIASLRANDGKIRVVLNKADQVNTQQVRCFSFNDKPIDVETASPMFCDLFEKEQNDLLMDLLDIPKKACDRRIHAYIISHLKKEMPSLMGKTKTQKRLINNLEDESANSEVKQSGVMEAEGCSLQEVLWKRKQYRCQSKQASRLYDVSNERKGLDMLRCVITLQNRRWHPHPSIILGLTKRKTIEDQTLLNRLGTTDDMVSAVAFSASDDASFLTRETLVVAGGMPSRLSSLS
ncbi:hypothetical protein NC651_009898 [Populus alba x Populus x berolinensis]|nr:hypothetical protein NC651_009898 [Populus alba x Populus x berolinensis]